MLEEENTTNIHRNPIFNVFSSLIHNSLNFCIISLLHCCKITMLDKNIIFYFYFAISSNTNNVYKFKIPHISLHHSLYTFVFNRS